jgi:hypothetical protein
MNSVSNREQVFTGHSDQMIAMEEENKFLRLLLQVSHEYLNKLLHEVDLSEYMRGELINVLQLMHNV